jgi:hypothetical protein
MDLFCCFLSGFRVTGMIVELPFFPSLYQSGVLGVGISVAMLSLAFITRPFTLKKLECSKQAFLPEYISME